MPARPKSEAQLGFVHAAANRGEDWAEKTVSEWHGQRFGNLPRRVHKVKRSQLKRRRA